MSSGWSAKVRRGLRCVVRFLAYFTVRRVKGLGAGGARLPVENGVVNLMYRVVCSVKGFVGRKTKKPL